MADRQLLWEERDDSLTTSQHIRAISGSLANARRQTAIQVACCRRRMLAITLTAADAECSRSRWLLPTPNARDHVDWYQRRMLAITLTAADAECSRSRWLVPTPNARDHVDCCRRRMLAITLTATDAECSHHVDCYRRRMLAIMLTGTNVECSRSHFIYGFCYTSRGALAVSRNSSMGPPWRTHSTISERSYHGATSPSVELMSTSLDLFAIRFSTLGQYQCALSEAAAGTLI